MASPVFVFVGEKIMSIQESCLARGIRRCGYHVCVLGIIGSGKTTLAQALQKAIAEKYGRCEGLWEPVEGNPLLPLYYKDPLRGYPKLNRMGV